jgi:hypothetical protein
MFSYSMAMGVLASLIFVFAAVIIGAGPEAKGVSFRKSGH